MTGTDRQGKAVQCKAVPTPTQWPVIAMLESSLIGGCVN
jgi:hypothetical protein